MNRPAHIPLWFDHRPISGYFDSAAPSAKKRKSTCVECLHDAVRTHDTRTSLTRRLVSFLHGAEKQQKTLELLIYFTERIKISAECVF